MESKKKEYYWECNGDENFFHDVCARTFNSKEECYNSMRNAALEKMKWNTEYSVDFDHECVDGVSTPLEEEDNYINYSVRFYPHKIIHESYSGTYVYEIKEVPQPEKSIFEGVVWGDMMNMDNDTKALFVGSFKIDGKTYYRLIEDGRFLPTLFNERGMRDEEGAAKVIGKYIKEN